MKGYQVVLAVLTAAAVVVVGAAAWLRLGPGSRAAAPAWTVSPTTERIAVGSVVPAPTDSGALPTLDLRTPSHPSPTPATGAAGASATLAEGATLSPEPPATRAASEHAGIPPRLQQERLKLDLLPLYLDQRVL